MGNGEWQNGEMDHSMPKLEDSVVRGGPGAVAAPSVAQHSAHLLGRRVGGAEVDLSGTAHRG